MCLENGPLRDIEQLTHSTCDAVKMGDMENNLQADEKQLARVLWDDLKRGVKEAPERLGNVPDRVRAAILDALVVAMDTRQTRKNPFD